MHVLFSETVHVASIAKNNDSAELNIQKILAKSLYV